MAASQTLVASGPFVSVPSLTLKAPAADAERGSCSEVGPDHPSSETIAQPPHQRQEPSPPTTPPPPQMDASSSPVTLVRPLPAANVSVGRRIHARRNRSTVLSWITLSSLRWIAAIV